MHKRVFCEPLDHVDGGQAFIFDVFHEAKNSIVLTVDRATEFCPLKNAPGSETDAPEQCRETISRLSLQRIRAVSRRRCPESSSRVRRIAQ